jgi:hypothetical protein
MSLSEKIKVVGFAIIALAAIIALLSSTGTSSNLNTTIANMTVNFIAFFYLVILGLIIVICGEVLKKFE